MKELLVRKVADCCWQSQVYELDGRKYEVAVDWRAVEAKVVQRTHKHRRLFGGLLPNTGWWRYMSSFGYCSRRQLCMVISPGNPRRKLKNAADLTPYMVKLANEQPEQVWRVAMGSLLAHESQHLADEVTGYGWKSVIIVPGIGLLVVVLAVRDFLQRQLPSVLMIMPLSLVVSVVHNYGLWWLVLAVTSFVTAAYWLYWHDWREVKARRYAAKHWQEWAEFVTVKPL